MLTIRAQALALRHWRVARLYTIQSESLLNRLKDDRKQFMRSKKQPDLNVVKGLLSDYTYHIKSPNAVAGQSENATVLSVLQKSVKRRQDAIAQYHAGGRPELAAQEQEELEILQRYQPAQMTPEAIEEALRTIVTELGASSIKDMGKVMKAWPHDAATADRKVVSDTVKQLLQS